MAVKFAYDEAAPANSTLEVTLQADSIDINKTASAHNSLCMRLPLPSKRCRYTAAVMMIIG